MLSKLYFFHCYLGTKKRKFVPFCFKVSQKTVFEGRYSLVILRSLIARVELASSTRFTVTGEGWLSLWAESEQYCSLCRKLLFLSTSYLRSLAGELTCGVGF